MKKTLIAFSILCVAAPLLAGPKGTVPRNTANQYPVHAQSDGITIGAKLLTRDEARKQFVSDVNRCCTVMEIAIYPDKGKSIDVSLNDLTLRTKDGETATKASPAPR